MPLWQQTLLGNHSPQTRVWPHQEAPREEGPPAGRGGLGLGPAATCLGHESRRSLDDGPLSWAGGGKYVRDISLFRICDEAGLDNRGFPPPPPISPSPYFLPRTSAVSAPGLLEIGCPLRCL